MTLDEVVINILLDRAWEDVGQSETLRTAQDRMADWIKDNPDDFWSEFGERFLSRIEAVALMTDWGEKND